MQILPMKSIYMEIHDMAGAFILSYPSVQLLVCIQSYVCVPCQEKEKKKDFFPPAPLLLLPHI